MSILSSRILLAATLVASTAACSKLGSHVPGGGGGAADPNACGGFSGAGDVGAKLKTFIQATKDLQDATTSAAANIKVGCVNLGKELNMAAGDLGGDDTGKICNAVIATYKANLSAGLKGSAALKASITPGKCTVDASASASAGAGCSGAASAGTGGAGGDAQCHAAASVEASVHAKCTPPQVSITVDASMVVDKPKVDLTVKALQDNLPAILTVGAQVGTLKDAVVEWGAAATALGQAGGDLAKSFGSQALCVSGQIAAVAAASANINANVNVSVSVSASASGSVGGG